MRYLILFTLSALMLSCLKEMVFPDKCPGCTFSSNLNGEPWVAKPSHSEGWIRHGDTTIFVAIRELEPYFNDKFSDALILNFIPFKTGIHVLDSNVLIFQETIRATFEVYEFENDFPAQSYYVLPDGGSWVNVEHLDKVTNAFRISFCLKMSVGGGPDGPLYNYSYPKVIEFKEGRIEGHLDFD